MKNSTRGVARDNQEPKPISDEELQDILERNVKVGGTPPLGFFTRPRWATMLGKSLRVTTRILESEVKAGRMKQEIFLNGANRCNHWRLVKSNGKK